MNSEIENLISNGQFKGALLGQALTFNPDGTIHHPDKLVGNAQVHDNNTAKIVGSIFGAISLIIVLTLARFWYLKRRNGQLSSSFLPSGGNEKKSMVETMKNNTMDSLSRLKSYITPKSNNEFVSTRTSLDDDCHAQEDVSAYLPPLNRSKSVASISTDSSNTTVEILNELSKIDKIEIKSSEMLTRI
jgi:hypothetical protein